MSTNTVTYGTVYPDGEGMAAFESLGDRGKPTLSTEKPPQTAPSVANGSLQSDKEKLAHYTTNNRTLLFGLALVAVILLGVIGYQAYYTKKVVDEAAAQTVIRTQGGENRLPGDGTWGGNAQPMYEPPNTGSTDTTQGRASQDAVRNDRILREKQNKTHVSAQKSQSALAASQKGRSAAEDRARLESITEENESDDGVFERTRSQINEQLQKDAREDLDDDQLGSGSSEILAADEDARRTAKDAEAKNAHLQGEQDEALFEQEDMQDQQSEKVVALCGHTLTHGIRAGQECHRECKPGKQKCDRHLAQIAKKTGNV